MPIKYKSIFVYIKNKTSHICEGEVPLRISFWHFLMNLENNYLLKKLLKWAKKCKNFNIYNVLFILKKQRETPGDIIILHVYQKS